MIRPSMEEWLQEAKEDPNAVKCGMYLVHNGVVRVDAKAKVREGKTDAAPVKGMLFDYKEDQVAQAIQKTYQMDGIYFVRVWMNRGELRVGDDIMYVMIGGDIRPHVVDALDFLVGTIKKECVVETELT